jgi:hypothetical protein
VADAALRQEGARSGGDRYQVVVHVDERALAGDEARGCALADGPALAAETVRRLACDAAIVRASERRGAPLGVGRKTRTIPAALRRALALRDRRCRFPGCENRHVDAHHVRHWARGGETALDNLVLLCRRHHRLVHEGGYAVDERRRFYDPRGRPITPVRRPPPGSVGELLERNRGLSVTPRTCKSGGGDPLDLGLAVAALCQRIAGLEITAAHVG